MTPRWRRTALHLAAVVLLVSGCRSQPRSEAAAAGEGWDAGSAEVLTWRADDPAFSQDHALEASGLAAAGGLLYASSEKYGRLLEIDPADSFRARVLRVGVPPFSELEGVAVVGSTAYLCDEAHAAVYAVDLNGAPQPAGGVKGALPARRLELEGVAVAGGKIGFEGVEVGRDGTIYLLLERSPGADGGCVSEIFRLRPADGRLVADPDPIVVPLEDCAWRLTGLALWHDGLLALKTQYPGNRYQVIAIDPGSGRSRLLLDMTELLRGLTAAGWGNNVEGIAVADDGSLYMVADNAVTGAISASEPPPTDERTLFIRLPPRPPTRGRR